jgi:hypothetical protein
LHESRLAAAEVIGANDLPSGMSREDGRVKRSQTALTRCNFLRLSIPRGGKNNNGPEEPCLEFVHFADRVQRYIDANHLDVENKSSDLLNLGLTVEQYSLLRNGQQLKPFRYLSRCPGCLVKSNGAWRKGGVFQASS